MSGHLETMAMAIDVALDEQRSNRERIRELEAAIAAYLTAVDSPAKMDDAHQLRIAGARDVLRRLIRP